MDRQNIVRNQRKLDEFKQLWKGNAVGISDCLANMLKVIKGLKEINSEMEMYLATDKATKKIDNFIAEDKHDGILLRQVRDTSDLTTAIENLVTEHNEIAERKKLLDEAAADETGCGRYPAKLGMDGVCQIMEKLIMLCETCQKVSERAGRLPSLIHAQDTVLINAA